MSLQKKKLAWRCRRGMRELDQMAVYFLEHCYDTVDEEYQRAFESLLEMSDPDFYDVLSGAKESCDPAIAAVSEMIRQHAAKN